MINTETFDRDPIGKNPGMKHRIAHLTSNVFNPFLLSVGLIVIFAARSSASFSEAVKWTSISVGLGILPVFLIIMYLLRHGKLDDFFIAAREQRTRIYFFGCVSAAAGCIALALLDAPTMLIAGFVTAISTAVIFALINLWWKISLHTAIAAASATILIIVYGWAMGATIAVVPLTAWSRIELNCHSFKQAVGGAVLATVLVLVLFQPIAMS